MSKMWFKHLYKGRLIITSGLNMFKPMGGPTLLRRGFPEETKIFGAFCRTDPRGVPSRRRLAKHVAKAKAKASERGGGL